MSKKIKFIIVIFIIPIFLGIQVSNVIAAVVDTSFFNTNKQEISPGETLEMTLDISNVQYDKFEFKLSSNLDTNNVVINEDVETEKYNNDISINIDKSKINLEKITLYYQVPENAQVGTKIELVAKIIVEDESQDDGNTSTTEVQENVVNSKTIEVNIVDKKQAENQVKTNEQENSGMTINEGNEGMTLDMEKQNFNLPNSESKVGNGEFSADTSKSMSSVKTQSTTFSTGSASFSGSSTLQAETAVYNGSNNNYLSSLEIEGETLNTTFNKEITTYFIETTGKTELTVNVAKEDDTSKVYITGNDNLKTGDNKILISVTAENGDVRYYRVFVTNNGVEK